MGCRVALGGTFDRLHVGHRRLIDTALSLGCREIIIGVVADELITRKALKEFIKPYRERVELIRRYIRSKDRYVKVTFVKLLDPYGPTISDADIDTIIVSEETLPRAIEINMLREARGLPPLKILTIEIVKAWDGRPLRATRVRLSEVDERGGPRTVMVTPYKMG